MVGVGAIIALMAGKLKKISDFKIDTELIKQKLISTADYIVKADHNTKQVILSPTKNENTVEDKNFATQKAKAITDFKNEFPNIEVSF